MKNVGPPTGPGGAVLKLSLATNKWYFWGYKQVAFLGLPASGISGATSKWYFWGYKQVAFLGLLLCGFHGKRSAALEGHISITAVPLAHSPSPAAKAPSNHVLECHIC